MTTEPMAERGEHAALRRHEETTRGTPVVTPPTDIYETDEALVLLVEMPGVGVDKADVSLDDHVLTIAGQSEIAAPTGYTLSHGEFGAVQYERSFRLADSVDASTISAVMTDGVLRVTLAKASAQPARKIAVGAG